jgi:biopolymer transport protein ExbD
LLVFAIGLPLGWQWWLSTRTWVPLEMPISLATGHIMSPEFEINWQRWYSVYLEVDRKFDYEGVPCLLGLTYQCKDPENHGVVKMAWSLTESGKEIARGSSEDTGGLYGDDAMGRALGGFAAGTSRHYVINLDVLEDGSRLAAGHPRLKIRADPWSYWEYESYWTNIVLLALVLGSAGTAILVASLVSQARERKASSRVSLTTTGPQPRQLFFETEEPRLKASGQGSSSRASLPFQVWAGAALFVSGLAAFAGMATWLHSRNWVPVDMPVSLARGHTRVGPFKINVRSHYSIGVEYGAPWKRAGNCFWYGRGKAKWSLFRNGIHVEDWYDPTPYATLGGFEGEPGTYELDLEIDSDTGCEDASRPRLQIYTVRSVFEDALSPWLWLSAFCVPCGTSLMVLGCLAAFRREKAAASELTGEMSVGQNFQWAQRLPLRKPFAGLPSFGLVAALVYIVFWLPMRLIDAMFFEARAARGIYVRSAQAVPAEKQSVAQPDPVVVRIEAGVFGSAPRLYLNGASVTWTDLQRAMQKGIGRRSDCTVFVSANDDAAWDEAAQVMDAARDLGCKVVLLTTEPEKPPAH